MSQKFGILGKRRRTAPLLIWGNTVHRLGPVIACLISSFACQGQCVYHAPDNQPYFVRFEFKPQNPQAAATLEDPLLKPGDASPPILKIVALGDSIMWGNGDLPGNRIANLVGRAVADETVRSVEVHSFAHSGARLEETDPDSQFLLPVQNGVPLGDLNAERPTTHEQAVCAAAIDSDAEIVLIDGCINEVGATDIALPVFPFINQTSTDQIDNRVRKYCSTNMETVLGFVRDHFQHATIVLLNYYRIVSKNSTPLGTPQTEIKNAVSEEMKLESRNEYLTQLPQELSLRVQKWSDNSDHFLTRSEACFKWAIACVNGAGSCSLTDPSEDSNCTPVPTSAPASIGGLGGPGPRVFLATVPDDPNYSYGAKEKHIWSMPSLLRPDEMYVQRVQLCKKYAPKDSSCAFNSSAHPDPVGARFYALGGQSTYPSVSIMGVLGQTWSKAKVSDSPQH